MLSHFIAESSLSAPIADIQMPGKLDGIELTDRVPPNDFGLPVLVVTGSSDAAKRTANPWVRLRYAAPPNR
jgi:CheY-like chemotaxis protein